MTGPKKFLLDDIFVKTLTLQMGHKYLFLNFPKGCEFAFNVNKYFPH